VKTISSRLLLGAFAVLIVAPGAPAQSEPTEKGPAAKVYIADAKGEAQVRIADKIHPARQSAAFDAHGAVIETRAKARSTVVFSNGTGMFIDENTRVEIERFIQEPFHLNADNTLDSTHEPSMSQSNFIIKHGLVAICTSQLLSGSSMVYSTPHASIIVRSGKLVIEVLAHETRVDLLEGDVTVRTPGQDAGGQVLQPGERAIVRPATAPGLEATLALVPIPNDDREKDEQRVAMACAARKSVTFEPENEAAGAGDQEIVPRPTVPTDPPTNIVISPDRLPGT
jgi:hypothetical protein